MFKFYVDLESSTHDYFIPVCDALGSRIWETFSVVILSQAPWGHQAWYVLSALPPPVVLPMGLENPGYGGGGLPNMSLIRVPWTLAPFPKS